MNKVTILAGARGSLTTPEIAGSLGANRHRCAPFRTESSSGPDTATAGRVLVEHRFSARSCLPRTGLMPETASCLCQGGLEALGVTLVETKNQS